MADKTETEKKDNLEFWESVEKTDPKHTKAVSIGARKYTAIDPAYQNKLATGVWGMYGNTWGLKDIKDEFMEIGLDMKMVTRYAVFYYPNGKFEITNSMKICGTNKNGNFIFDEDWAKKIETNTVSKALSKLGFNTDVFLGKFEDYQYVEEMKAEHTQINQDQLSELIRLISATKSDATKFNETFGIKKVSEMKQSDYNKALAMLNSKLAKADETKS